jgi:hypothetical protein
MKSEVVICLGSEYKIEASVLARQHYFGSDKAFLETVNTSTGLEPLSNVMPIFVSSGFKSFLTSHEAIFLL